MSDLTALPPLPFSERRWSRMSMTSISRQPTRQSEGGDSIAIAPSVDLEKRMSRTTAKDDGTIVTPTPAGTTSSPPSTHSEEYQYPDTKTVILVIVAIMLAVFLMALDRTIIATAVPKITDEFNSLDDIGWYASAYMLTGSCFQLMLGRVYSFYPPKWVFLLLITVFEAGSAVCAAAPSSTAFIIGRAVAGLGSAGIMSGNIILLTSVVPLAKRPIYMGFFGALMGVSSVLGPLLGGALTTDVSWRWCFYINLPIGGFAMIVIFFTLPAMPPVEPNLSFRKQLSRLDLAGQAFLFPSIVSLLIALQWGGSKYPWSNGRIIALLTVFAVTFVGFVLVQIFMQKTATISARVIKNRSIISGIWFNVCVGCVIIVMVYYIALWFQAIKGKSAVESGIATIPLMLSMVVGAVAAGQLTGRIGYYNPSAILCCLVMPVGVGLISTWTPTTEHPMWIGYQVVFGFGLGVGIQQGAMAAQTVLKRKDVPMGVSMMMFAQQLSGAIFISVAQNIFDKHLIAGFTPLLEKVHPGSTISPQSIVSTGATDIRGVIPAQYLPLVLPVYNKAIRETFYLPLAMACAASIGGFTLEWRSVKAPRAKDDHSDDEHDEYEQSTQAAEPQRAVETQVPQPVEASAVAPQHDNEERESQAAEPEHDLEKQEPQIEHDVEKQETQPQHDEEKQESQPQPQPQPQHDEEEQEPRPAELKI